MRTIVHDVAHQQVAADGHVLEQRQVRRALVDHRRAIVWDACAAAAPHGPQCIEILPTPSTSSLCDSNKVVFDTTAYIRAIAQNT